MMRAIALVAVLALAACTPTAVDQPKSDGPAASQESQCERVVRRASEVDEMQDTVTDLDDAIYLCDSIEDLIAASRKHPAAFDGVDEREFVRTRCLAEPDMQPGPVCQAVLP